MTLLQLIIFHNFLSHILYTDSIFNVNPKLVWSSKKKKKNFFLLLGPLHCDNAVFKENI